MNARSGLEAAHASRHRFAARERLIGSLIKTPTSHAIEIMGDLGFDFVVIDEEHAAFDRQSIDIALLAARANGVAGIVRVAEARASSVLSALDCGATGVLVPHVLSVEKARDVASWSRYRGGRRGYSGSARAGRYGATPVWTNVDESDARTTVIAMIEYPEALDAIDAIARRRRRWPFHLPRRSDGVARGRVVVGAGGEGRSAADFGGRKISQQAGLCHGWLRE